jgi:hypothetical protein
MLHRQGMNMYKILLALLLSSSNIFGQDKSASTPTESDKKAKDMHFSFPDPDLLPYYKWDKTKSFPQGKEHLRDLSSELQYLDDLSLIETTRDQMLLSKQTERIDQEPHRLHVTLEKLLKENFEQLLSGNACPPKLGESIATLISSVKSNTQHITRADEYFLLKKNLTYPGLTIEVFPR